MSRGFARMNKEKQREIASLGGKAAHARGHAHEFTPDEAREAGKKGGRAVSANRDHMSRIGRKGGLERGRRAALRLAAGTSPTAPLPVAPPTPSRVLTGKKTPAKKSPDGGKKPAARKVAAKKERTPVKKTRGRR